MLLFPPKPLALHRPGPHPTGASPRAGPGGPLASFIRAEDGGAPGLRPRPDVRIRLSLFLSPFQFAARAPPPSLAWLLPTRCSGRFPAPGTPHLLLRRQGQEKKERKRGKKKKKKKKREGKKKKGRALASVVSSVPKRSGLRGPNASAVARLAAPSPESSPGKEEDQGVWGGCGGRNP